MGLLCMYAGAVVLRAVVVIGVATVGVRFGGSANNKLVFLCTAAVPGDASVSPSESRRQRKLWCDEEREPPPLLDARELAAPRSTAPLTRVVRGGAAPLAVEDGTGGGVDVCGGSCEGSGDDVGWIGGTGGDGIAADDAVSTVPCDRLKC